MDLFLLLLNILYLSLMILQTDSNLVSRSRTLHFVVNEVVSKVHHEFQSAQDQTVNIIIVADFVAVVLHRQDAVHRDPQRDTEPFQLQFGQTECW